MLYTAIFVGLFVMGWLICAFLPWLVVSVITRGHAGLGNLPICLFAGVVGALAIPVFGLTGGMGLWLSFIVAAAVSAILLGIRHFSLRPTQQHESAQDRTVSTTREESHTK